MTHPWEELARQEPYYAVLTDERFLKENLSKEVREAFFASGEADVARIFAALSSSPRSALDFGCGVGRLTRALAKRVDRVVGVDISQTMLAHARANVPAATFSTTIPDEQFDLIVSLIVLQHVPVRRGMEILRDLMSHLRGSIVLQVPVSRPGGLVRRIGRRIRSYVPLLYRDARGLPYMEMNPYDLSTLRSEIERSACAIHHVEPTNHGGIEGVIMVAHKL